MLNIPSHVQISFDPADDPETKKVFQSDVCRRLWLAWSGFGFLRSNHFTAKVWIIGCRLEVARPRTEERAAECLQGFPMDFKDADVKAFLPHFMPILRGERDITYSFPGQIWK